MRSQHTSIARASKSLSELHRHLAAGLIDKAEYAAEWRRPAIPSAVATLTAATQKKWQFIEEGDVEAAMQTPANSGDVFRSHPVRLRPIVLGALGQHQLSPMPANFQTASRFSLKAQKSNLT